MPLDIRQIRQQFPILRGNDLVYLDSAATAQKPQIVLNAMQNFYETENANVHRGMHGLAEKATIAYEDARKTVADFIGAAPYEIVFTKNCTESINLVAHTWAKANLKKGDTVMLSVLEHHSNIVPWLQLKEEIGITVEWFSDVPDVFDKSVKLVAVTGLSNVVGVRLPIEEIIQKAKAVDAKILIDAAQLVVHEPLDVKALDCDFLTFSGHKLYGPTGIGVLFAKRELLESMPPSLGGGSMVGTVTKDYFTTADIPQKFEAGTPPIAEAVGLGAAINWLKQFNWKDIQTHEQDLMHYATEQLSSINNLTTLNSQLSTLNSQLGCISFTLNNIHPHDLTEYLGKKNICLRAGHHCTQPLHEHLGVKASTRMSFGIYNTKEEIDACISALQKI